MKPAQSTRRTVVLLVLFRRPFPVLHMTIPTQDRLLTADLQPLHPIITYADMLSAPHAYRRRLSAGTPTAGSSAVPVV